MVGGLQIHIGGEELIERIGERVRAHEATIGTLDARIKEREGDQPFDVRAEDGFKTLGELEGERQHYRDRVTHLTLLRNNLVPGEIYALKKSDLRLAELISPDFVDASGVVHHDTDGEETAAIDGLKLSVSGLQLREMLEERIRIHQARGDRWRHELERTPADQTEDEPLLPDHMCANEAERHDWRIKVLEFIRDHVDGTAIYRLGESDLAFGELLPEKPEWMEQQEFEERTSIGFHLGRIAKNVERFRPSAFEFAAGLKEG